MEKKSFFLKTFVTVLFIALLWLFSQQDQFRDEVEDTAIKIDKCSFNIIILTDLHYDPVKFAAGEPNVLDPTMEAIKLLSKKIRINAYWNLGDFINGHNTKKNEAMEQIKTVVEKERNVSADFHNIAGNHDNNVQSTYDSNAGYAKTEVLSVDELNEIIALTSISQPEVHNPKRMTDYYVDFDELRITCISADYTTFQPETVEWLKTIALKTERPVLVLSHIPTRPEWGFKNDVEGGQEIEQAICDFISAGGKIIAYIHGHDHGDNISTVMDNEGNVQFHEIGIGCARFQYPQSDGTPGMTFWERNEKDKTLVLFDVVSIDFEKGILKFVRFGAGEDREINIDIMERRE